MNNYDNKFIHKLVTWLHKVYLSVLKDFVGTKNSADLWK